MNAGAMDFANLRREGIGHLEKLIGEVWTDFNTHDPGITILEQLCYALTDFGYRAQYALPDLLAGQGGDPYASLYTPAQILPSSAVTLADLRKLVIDVPGVRNAWIEAYNEPAAVFDAALGEVSFPAANNSGAKAPSPNVSEIRIRGLYRVLIEKSSLIDLDGSVIRAEAARRLHRARPLGVDFHEIKVLEEQPIRLHACVEVDASVDASALLAAIYLAIATSLSPAVPFSTLEELLARGRRVDQIFEGPLLEQGFIDAEDLANIERCTSLRVSDLINTIMSVPGVAAVTSLHFISTDGTLSKDWLIDIEADKTPRFDLPNSDICLERRGMQVDECIRPAAQNSFVTQAKQAARPLSAISRERDLRPQPGRDRNVANCRSVQEDFPLTYGIGSIGLPQSAAPRRKAQAKQLKAYLMFYDQLIANQFAQLANAGKLFSFHDDSAESYFSQVVQDEGGLRLDELRLSDPDKHRAALERITEEPRNGTDADAKTGLTRRNRFLDHLLARFGVQLHDYALLLAGSNADAGADVAERLARDKRAYLRDLPKIGRERGTAFNCLAPTAVGSPNFISGDLIDATALAAELNAASRDSLSGYLWSRLTADEQSALIDPIATREAKEAVLIAALGRIVHGESIYTPERFAVVSLSAETENLVGRSDGAAQQVSARLNRMLLEDAYPQMIARNCDPENVSGLELVLRRKLGIAETEARFHLVEHVLLRPIPGDANQSGPLFRAAQVRDPYSLQITVVFPNWPDRCKRVAFRQLVEKTVQEETPAHLSARVLWKDRTQMQAFESAYGVWLRQWRNYRRAELGF